MYSRAASAPGPEGLASHQQDIGRDAYPTSELSLTQGRGSGRTGRRRSGRVPCRARGTARSRGNVLETT